MNASLCFLSPNLIREILQYTKEVTPWIYIEDRQKKIYLAIVCS